MDRANTYFATNQQTDLYQLSEIALPPHLTFSYHSAFLSTFPIIKNRFMPIDFEKIIL